MMHPNHHPALSPGDGDPNQLEREKQIHLELHKGKVPHGLSHPPGQTPRDDPGSPSMCALRSPAHIWQACDQVIPRLHPGRKGVLQHAECPHPLSRKFFGVPFPVQKQSRGNGLFLP